MFMKKGKLCAALLAMSIAIGGASFQMDAEAATRAEIGQISVNQKGSNFQYWIWTERCSASARLRISSG